MRVHCMHLHVQIYTKTATLVPLLNSPSLSVNPTPVFVEHDVRDVPPSCWQGDGRWYPHCASRRRSPPHHMRNAPRPA